MGFLLPPSANSENPVVWRGLMVMKAVQQLLFEVDWRSLENEETLDILVIDMPPGTGDVQLSLGQLVAVDGAVVVTTPQDVALIDTRKGVSMFRKVGIPILGAVLNMSHFKCNSCGTDHQLFGNTTSFDQTLRAMSIDKLAELPLDPITSQRSDSGIPVAVGLETEGNETALAFGDLSLAVLKRLPNLV